MVGLRLDHGFRWEMLWLVFFFPGKKTTPFKDSIMGFFQEGGFLIFHNYIWVFPVTPLFLDLPFNSKIERFKLSLKFWTRFFHSNRRFRKAPGPCALLAWWKETTGDACPALWPVTTCWQLAEKKPKMRLSPGKNLMGFLVKCVFYIYMYIYM